MEYNNIPHPIFSNQYEYINIIYNDYNQLYSKNIYLEITNYYFDYDNNLQFVNKSIPNQLQNQRVLITQKENK